MLEISLVVLFTAAIAIGFLLGKYTSKKNKTRLSSSFQENHLKDLNFLLDAQEDKEIETFIENLDVNTHTLETHFALGRLMRKQGQVDRAIRIHQNLLARPVLEEKEQHQVHLELARDFMKAGLLDRAEMLLQQVINESSSLKSIAQRYLMDIYQDEQEWLKALDVAQVLLSSRPVRADQEYKSLLSKMVAHFYCELAEQGIEQKNPDQVSLYLNKAIAADKTVLRSVLLSAINDNLTGRYKSAIKSIVKLESVNPPWLVLCMPVLLEAYQGISEDKGFDQWVQHVSAHVKRHKSPYVLMYLIDKLLQKTDERDDYREVAIDLLSSDVELYDTLLSSNKLVGLKLEVASDENLAFFNDIVKLQSKVDSLLSSKSIYRCISCGFSGRQLHWRCPSCKQWETGFPES